MTTTTPLSIEEIFRHAPSVFATEASSRTSNRYSFVPTHEILVNLIGQGWETFSASQTHSRSSARNNYGKHILRLRHPDFNFGEIDSEFPELVIINSHDGGSALKALAGIFRLICTNGMIVGNTTGSIRVQHRNLSVGDIIDLTEQFADKTRQFGEDLPRWKETVWDESFAREFAGEAAKLRWEDPSEELIDLVNRPRRVEDTANTAWNVFNRAQESVIRGGFRHPETNRMQKQVNSVTQNVTLNQGLWDLYESFLERN